MARKDTLPGVGALLAGMGIGAALMYFLDPQRGGERWAHVRDRARSSAGDVGDRVGRTARDVRNRASGAVAELRGRRAEQRPPDADTLVARVRAEIGHHTERARDIDVVADGGAVVLQGRVPASDLPRILAAARAVRGVERVEDRLVVE